MTSLIVLLLVAVPLVMTAHDLSQDFVRMWRRRRRQRREFQMTLGLPPLDRRPM